MKSLIVYFLLSGDTRKITEAIVKVTENNKLISIKEFQSPMLTNFDPFYIGYWVGKGDCGAIILRLLTQLKDKRIVLSGTLGAAERIEYYDRARQQMESHAAHCHILGHFLCRGAVGEVVIARYQSMLAEHPQDEHVKQQLVNYESGESHPDKQDLANARAFAKSIG